MPSDNVRSAPLRRGLPAGTARAWARAGRSNRSGILFDSCAFNSRTDSNRIVFTPQLAQVLLASDVAPNSFPNRRLENAVEQGMAAARDDVQRIVTASNAAPGETAAAQAHVDLVAVASGELGKLQALRTARSRLRTEELARDQSEQAYAAAQRSAVRDGWDAPAPPTGGMVPAFGE